MNIKSRTQISIHQVNNKSIDLFLFANNIEKRKLTAYNTIKAQNNIVTGVALTYPNGNTEKVKNVENVIINKHQEILSLLDNKLSKIDNTEITIFVDYSCMTKSWYYSILLYFVNKKSKFKKVKILFSYTPSKYSKPLPPKPNTDIQPLPGKYIIPNNKPKALIVCLGYEQNKAQGIIDQLDPKITYVFYSKPALDDKFVNRIERNNKSIIEGNQNIITFPFNSLLYIERELISLYYLLRDEYNIIIAPLGPKPFSFVAMMLSAIYNDIDIWRVGSGFDINEYERVPFETENSIICEVMFEQ